MMLRFFLISLILACGKPLMAQTVESSCAPITNALPHQLQVGALARVVPPFTLNLRPQPDTTQARLLALTAGQMVDVVAGPVCQEGYSWWQVTVEDVTGWVVEGDPQSVTYWLEPRGHRIALAESDNPLIPLVQLSDGTIEPAGCMRPPDDYTLKKIDYATFNQRTLAMLDQAQRIYDQMAEQIEIDSIKFRQLVVQGGYNPGGVTASFGTHDGGGAVDISVRRVADWRIMRESIEPMILALRIAGFAAWLRDTGDLYPDSPIHIHAIAIGDVEASPIALQQVSSAFGYLQGYDGLPRDDGAYQADRHGGPIICGWISALDLDSSVNE